MTSKDPKTLCTTHLAEGKDYFGLMLGIVSRIKNDVYEVFSVHSNTGMPEPGTVYDLRAVYCRAVYEGGETVAITQINETPGMRLHPLYATIPCEVYISAPIMVSGQVWGTLNYTSMLIHDRDFSSNDIEFIENQAAEISAAIERTDI